MRIKASAAVTVATMRSAFASQVLDPAIEPASLETRDLPGGASRKSSRKKPVDRAAPASLLPTADDDFDVGWR